MGLIRFLLAIAVVDTHLFNAEKPFPFGILCTGKVAVQFFFIISGFYMGLVLNTKYGYRGSYKQFLAQRFLRIYPAYWAMLVFWAVAALVIRRSTGIENAAFHSWNRYGAEMTPLTVVALAVPQIVLFGLDWSYSFGLVGDPRHLAWTAFQRTVPLPAWYFVLILQAWSLGLELTFYLVAPLLCRWKLRWQVAAAVGLLAGEMLASAVWKLNYSPWNYRFFPFELQYFMAGSAGYQIYSRYKSALERNQGLLWSAFVGAVLLTLVYKHIHFWHWELVYLTIMAACVPCVFCLTKDIRGDRMIGELSYPLYLVHQFWITTVPHFMKGTPPRLQGWVGILVSIGAAVLMLKLVDQPVDRWRARYFERTRAERG